MPLASRCVLTATRRHACWPGALLGLLIAAGIQLAGGHALVVAAAPVAESATAAETNAAATDLELAVVARVNADRVANGLAPLAFDPKLLAVARRRAADQVPLSHLSHYDATGQVVVPTLLAAARLDYVFAGENLARLPGPDETTAMQAEEALMDSPAHRANILEPLFNQVAVGAATDSSGRVILAQLFRAIEP